MRLLGSKTPGRITTVVIIMAILFVVFVILTA